MNFNDPLGHRDQINAFVQGQQDPQVEDEPKSQKVRFALAPLNTLKVDDPQKKIEKELPEEEKLDERPKDPQLEKKGAAKFLIQALDSVTSKIHKIKISLGKLRAEYRDANKMQNVD